MSRLAKKGIEIPKGVELTVAGSTVTVKGAKGTLVRTFGPEVSLIIDNGTLHLTPIGENAGALSGTYASHILNMIEGVVKGFEKKLVIEGIGYRAEQKGTDIVFALGFSHPVKMPVPSELKATIEKNVITITGIDKDIVGLFAAKIRDLKKPEPYKGKGIRYEKEVIHMKQGKKAA